MRQHEGGGAIRGKDCDVERGKDRSGHLRDHTFLKKGRGRRLDGIRTERNQTEGVGGGPFCKNRGESPTGEEHHTRREIGM